MGEEGLERQGKEPAGGIMQDKKIILHQGNPFSLLSTVTQDLLSCPIFYLFYL